MLVPAYLSSRTTIVIYKQRKARSRIFAFKKLFIDIALLGIAGYGLYAYKMRQQALMIAGVSGTDLAIDPLLFIISTLFILGAGLVFLRFSFNCKTDFPVGQENGHLPCMLLLFM